jgi:hypothetical protein
MYRSQARPSRSLLNSWTKRERTARKRFNLVLWKTRIFTVSQLLPTGVSQTCNRPTIEHQKTTPTLLLHRPGAYRTAHFNAAEPRASLSHSQRATCCLPYFEWIRLPKTNSTDPRPPATSSPPSHNVPLQTQPNPARRPGSARSLHHCLYQAP